MTTTSPTQPAQRLLFIVHAPPYGSERVLSALRLALMLASRDGADRPLVQMFLMSDATVLGLPHQQDAQGSGLQAMVEQLVDEGVEVALCRTCAQARGLVDLPLIAGLRIGTLAELADWTLAADKVLSF